MSDLILTSKIGRFTFEPGTVLSLAKLVRDAVTGQWLSPHDRQPELYSVSDAYEFIRSAESMVIKGIGFELELYPEYAVASAMYRIGGVVSHFGEAFKHLKTSLNEAERAALAFAKAHKGLIPA